jgi:cell division control protein 6
VFGAANLILAELGEPSLKSAQGINMAIDRIGSAISAAIEKEKSKLFVLVLDEFDVLFYDKRGKPSDFIYKLLVMEEKLREKSCLMTIVAISNNVVADYEIDDRVRSRIGSSEILFDAYSKKDVLEILKDRAAAAFSKPIDPAVLEYCAEQSSSEHGDARRAIDLLRVAAEIASSKGEEMSKAHVDKASDELQQGRVTTTLSAASYHFKLACSALARITFLIDEQWHSTSTIYKQYCKIIAKGNKPLTYRRVSELLTECENIGLAVSQTGSKGRHGYGTQYKLTVPPEAIGTACFPNWWENLVERRKQHERDLELQKLESVRSKSLSSLGGKGFLKGELFPGLRAQAEARTKKNWDDFVGL